MSSTLTLTFDPQDIESWKQQMRRLNTHLGETKLAAARVGGIALLRAIQSSTPFSRPRRKVRVAKSAKNRRANGNRIFAMETLNTTTGAMFNIPLFYPDLATAKLHPGAKIRNQGLARMSWGWAMQTLFKQYSPANYRGHRPTDILRYYTENLDGTGDVRIEIENRVRYMSNILQGGRGPAVSSAMARAAQTMKGRIDQALKQATRDAGY